MGYWKNKMIDEQERGWSSLGNKFVCAKCFTDEALKAFINENAVERKCDYCNRRSKKKIIAAPIDDVIALINESIHFNWDDPDNEGICYVSSEGGYQGKVTDSWDLFHDELDITENDGLLHELIDAFGSQGNMWCDRHYYGLSPENALRLGWEKFVKTVKHSIRYLFLANMENDENNYGGKN